LAHAAVRGTGAGRGCRNSPWDQAVCCANIPWAGPTSAPGRQALPGCRPRRFPPDLTNPRTDTAAAEKLSACPARAQAPAQRRGAVESANTARPGSCRHLRACYFILFYVAVCRGARPRSLAFHDTRRGAVWPLERLCTRDVRAEDGARGTIGSLQVRRAADSLRRAAKP
jgi:hypothetical protein